MKLEWQSETYHRVRSNFYSQFDMFHAHIALLNELIDHSAKMVRIRGSVEADEVCDNLGMNENYEIQFDDYDKFILFLLRWT